MSDKTRAWNSAKEWLADKRANLDKNGYADIYQQHPVCTGLDLASPDGDYSVRWNNRLGCYEHKRPGGRWEH